MFWLDSINVGDNVILASIKGRKTNFSIEKIDSVSLSGITLAGFDNIFSRSTGTNVSEYNGKNGSLYHSYLCEGDDITVHQVEIKTFAYLFKMVKSFLTPL